MKVLLGNGPEMVLYSHLFRMVTITYCKGKDQPGKAANLKPSHLSP